MTDTEKKPTKEDCENCCAITEVKILRNGDYILVKECGKQEIKRK
jgi:hypothetical protein